MPQETVLPRASQKQTATIQKQPTQAPSTVLATGDTASATTTTSRLAQVSTIRTRIRTRRARNLIRKPPKRSHHSRRTDAPPRFTDNPTGRTVEGDAGAATGTGPVPATDCADLVAVACAGISPYCPEDTGAAAGEGGTAPAGTPPDGARPHPDTATGVDPAVWEESGMRP
ncbi:hypothetical protein [uncultured Actinomyces sp.]|uniref:hypothetical protein n=1 Tax=uncultured Actinomyces sp. TaxID=249061 RepID=UPI0028D21DAB|nr:hypothetical protein [uncultured Actinomyces sp.]